MSVNRVILVGNLGKDPEIRNLEGGAKVASFSLATSEKYTNKSGEKVDQTEWHNIQVWGKLADIVEQWMKKGQMVYIEGRLRTRSWEDKDKVKRYTTEILADNIKMLGGKRDENNTQSGFAGTEKSVQSADKDNSIPAPDDDLPF
ncbi:MAG: single-stranded DNA-binding protein [Bacteroidota bacterium]